MLARPHSAADRQIVEPQSSSTSNKASNRDRSPWASGVSPQTRRLHSAAPSPARIPHFRSQPPTCRSTWADGRQTWCRAGNRSSREQHASAISIGTSVALCHAWLREEPCPSCPPTWSTVRYACSSAMARRRSVTQWASASESVTTSTSRSKLDRGWRANVSRVTLAHNAAPIAAARAAADTPPGTGCPATRDNQSSKPTTQISDTYHSTKQGRDRL
jgi:hypothetical protein